MRSFAGRVSRDKKPEMAYNTIMKSLEIFAGGGGLALGVTAAGFAHTSLIEWDADSAKTLHHNYTVIGYWPDSMQRFADYIEAENPEEAEKAIMDKHSGVSICAVIEGQHQCADNYGYVRSASE
jgi:site-specific DNA-cytosine methylase